MSTGYLDMRQCLEIGAVLKDWRMEQCCKPGDSAVSLVMSATSLELGRILGS